MVEEVFAEVSAPGAGVAAVDAAEAADVVVEPGVASLRTRRYLNLTCLFSVECSCSGQCQNELGLCYSRTLNWYHIDT